MKRTAIFRSVASLVLVGLLASAALAEPVQPSKARSEISSQTATLPSMTVYKTPTCGCCSAWADHMTEDGFAVTVVERTDLSALKQQLGVPAGLQSCHTAVVGDYVIEGHVPASDVRKLLASKSTLRGLAVPGMPMGSPGMESDRPPAQYQVIGFDGDQMSVYSSHRGTQLTR